jgi:glycosyltransferase involved in cell wall biosynthesis
MRILHVDPAPTWRGGERQVFLLTRELRARGHDSRVVAHPDGPLFRRIREVGMPVDGVRMAGDLDGLAIARLMRLLSRVAPDVLHLHTARAHAVGGIAARLAGFRRVLVTRRVELPIRGAFSRWKYAHLGDHYVAISEAVERSLLAGGVAAASITRIPSGVPIPEARPPISEPRPWTVGTLAAFTPQKDPPTWVATVRRVLAEAPDVRFVWAGEGELRRQVEVEVQTAGLAHAVEFPGFLGDLEPFWRQIDAFFLPSAFEALGTVLLDGMARGVPIVATRVGGIPEVIRHGMEGDLRESGDAHGLAEALLRLRREPDRADRFAEAGRRRVGEFAIERVVDRVVDVYERLGSESP